MHACVGCAKRDQGGSGDASESHRALVGWLKVGHPGATRRLITGFRCRRLFEQHFLYTTHSETHAANQAEVDRKSDERTTPACYSTASARFLVVCSWQHRSQLWCSANAFSPPTSCTEEAAPEKEQKPKKSLPYSSCFSQPGCHGSMVVNGEQGKPKQCGLRSFRSRD